mgnify:CR=1 FL=1
MTTCPTCRGELETRDLSPCLLCGAGRAGPFVEFAAAGHALVVCSGCLPELSGFLASTVAPWRIDLPIETWYEPKGPHEGPGSVEREWCPACERPTAALFDLVRALYGSLRDRQAESRVARLRLRTIDLRSGTDFDEMKSAGREDGAGAAEHLAYAVAAWCRPSPGDDDPEFLLELALPLAAGDADLLADIDTLARALRDD